MRTRRYFLQASLAAALGTGHTISRGSAPARKLRIAGIGIGGMGLNTMTDLAGEDIIAPWDVDHRHAAPAFA